MRRIAIIAATAAMLLTSAPAEAQGRGYGRGDDRRSERGYERGGDRGEDRGGDRGRARGEDRRYEARPDPRQGDRRYDAPPPEAAPQRSWRQGERLPPMYRGGYIRDPGRNRLRPAPPGYDWVGVGPDIYLVQRSTGMVRDSIPGGY